MCLNEKQSTKWTLSFVFNCVDDCGLMEFLLFVHTVSFTIRFHRQNVNILWCFLGFTLSLWCCFFLFWGSALWLKKDKNTRQSRQFVNEHILPMLVSWFKAPEILFTHQLLLTDRILREHNIFCHSQNIFGSLTWGIPVFLYCSELLSWFKWEDSVGRHEPIRI